MANITEPQLTYRVLGGSPLTHDQMNNNFRSLVYSSSVSPDGEQLRLHYDIVGGYCHTIALNGGSGGLSVTPNTAYQIVTTATGTVGSLQSENNLKFDGNLLTLTGTFSINDGEENIIIGASAGGSVSSGENTIIGHQAGNSLTSGVYNTVLGHTALVSATTATRTVALGNSSLESLVTGLCNVGIGYLAGSNLANGSGNIYIGDSAGPTSAVDQSNKLYINNSESDTPLILGDFSSGQVTFNSQVSASVFSGSYYGDGSNLTGVTATAEWDGSIDGDVSITGSLIVSGTAVTVDFTNVESISGSIFSGSFVGDGSLLTGVQAETFPYTGSAIISGSLLVENSTILSGSSTVSGSFTVHGPSDLNGVTTIDQNIKVWNPSSTTLAIGSSTVQNSTVIPARSIFIGAASGFYATGADQVAIGDSSAQIGAQYGVAIGYRAGYYASGRGQIAIGYRALGSFNTAAGQHNIAIGCKTMGGNPHYGGCNVGIGCQSLYQNQYGGCNTAVGVGSLRCLIGINIGDGNRNTAFGYCAGTKTKFGNGNLYLGHKAGPSVLDTTESNRLYISNNEGNPLIGGHFGNKTVTISGSLTVSQSVTADSFTGDGSGLTNLPEGEWDGSRNGNAEITGSFTVSGSDVIVDFTNTLAISGSTFSGSFVGDGSGLTGIAASEWDGSRNGDSNITGSLIVSGALDVSNTITIASQGYPGGPGVELIHFHSSSLAGVHNIQSFAISATGYTGFKADYSLSDSTEDEKKIGTLLGAWDQVGGETLNDSHTVATGNIIGTSFSIDSDGSTAILKLDASTGTYDVNILITAFKRQV
jgi:hypothetical protein